MAAQNPLFRPVGEGFLGRGLVVVYPILRGASYWFRYPSMMFRYNRVEFDFAPALGPRADALLTPVLVAFGWIVGPFTVLLCLWAFIWYWKRHPPATFSRISADATSREWLVGFVRWTFLGSLVSFALSPTTIMSWQVFVIMHVTVLPTVFWLADLWRRRSPRWIGKAIAVHIVVLSLLSLAMSVGSPMYRKGGRDPVRLVVKQRYPFLTKLGIDRHSTVVVDPELGYSTDPEEHAVRVD